MESHHDGTGGAFLNQWVALALFRYGELENTFSVIISVADIEGERRNFP
jgi:hypothetical protein